MRQHRHMNRRHRLIAVVSILLFLIVAAICFCYLGDYYRADISAITAYLPQNSAWKEESDGTIVFTPENAVNGLIFYPGGKVEYTAYLPLMQALSEYGILCVLVEMPFHLAVLDVNAADGIQKEYPQIEHWYIGGHSLGGAMASSYLAANADQFDGLVLLGAYSTSDLSNTELDVLSVYGSEDKVMNREQYESNRSNLPDDFTEFIVDGGCHAGFGMYGAQEGDGIPSVSNEDQIAQTANAILSMINNTQKGNENTITENQTDYRSVSMEDAALMMEAEQNYIILDVRTEAEFAKKRIPGAINIPNETIGSDEIPALPDKNQLILVYCRSGNRSKQASKKLAALGYTNIVEFGGINDWHGETESN